MRRLLIFSAVLLAASALGSDVVWAQGRGAAGGGGGMQGSFGQAGGFGGQAGSFGQSGGGMGGGSSFGAAGGSGFGGSSGMNRGGSTGVFGNRSVGSGTTSQRNSGFTGSAGGQSGGRFSSMGFSDPSQMFQSGGRAQGAFTGAQTGGQAGGQNMNALGGLATGLAMSGLQNLRGGNQGRGNRGQQQAGRGGNRANGRQQERTVRTVLTLGFQVTPRNQPVLATTVAQRLANSRGVDAMSPVTVTMQDRTAILRGVVPTDHARTIAEQLALLEPGVSHVQNELSVAAATTSEPAGATATAAPQPRSATTSATVQPTPENAYRPAR